MPSSSPALKFQDGFNVIRHVAFVALALGIAVSHSLGETPRKMVVSPGEQCRIAIDSAERAQAVPDHLLSAIGQVESGRRNPATGKREPWPWTIDVSGQSTFFSTEAEAIVAVRAMQVRGISSIDVGCVQINLAQHPHAFRSLEDAFNPDMNAHHGAAFLSRLLPLQGAGQRLSPSITPRRPCLA